MVYSQKSFAYFRKYRPQTLKQLMGQEHIVDTLTKAYKSNRLSQAYLFCGPKGTGKTSTARILAKLVNCESSIVNREDKTDNRSTINDLPCNACSSCISITDGSNLDLIEIDAASNRGIDDIRELREKIKLAPTSSRKKVYIIDEVHMLSPEAFNALLKTLEEPPEHVLFILATTEVHKIPETILSRVQKLDFKIATQKDLYKALKNVVDTEKLKIDEEALLYLAKKASGSFRDGIKLLDQLSSEGEKITLKKAEQALKSSDFNHLISVLDSISQNDSSTSLSKVLEQVELGINVKEYIFSMMDLLRTILFIKQGLTSIAKEDLGTEKFMEVNKLAEKFTLNNLLRTLEIFREALEKMKTTSIVSLPLEVAIIEAASLDAKPKSIIVESSPKVEIASSSTPRNDASAALSAGVTAIRPAGGAAVSEIVSDIKPRTDSPDLSVIRDKWNYILETIKPYNYSLEAMLKLVKILECTNNVVMIEVPYSFHQRILDAPKSRSLLESVLSEVLGRAVAVSTVLGQKPVDREELANVEIAADDEIIRIASEIFNSESVN